MKSKSAFSEYTTVSSSLLRQGQRRFEASSYLSDGYGLRRRIEYSAEPWKALSEVCSVWQPSRLKGYETAPAKGLPFLSAGQVFEQTPTVRKWISKPLTPNPDSRLVDERMMLLSCSGVVGRITAVYEHHLNKIITHDLLRLVPNNQEDYGWLYAYLRTDLFKAIAKSAQYGHMIKHLEVEHASSFPVLWPNFNCRQSIGSMAIKALELRRLSMITQQEALSLFHQTIGLTPESESNSIKHTAINISSINTGRRRLDAQFYSEQTRNAKNMVSTYPSDTLASLCHRVDYRKRFTRHFSTSKKGTPYVSASELFDVNAPITKRIYKDLVINAFDYVLKKGWLVMACSGQVYGLLGRVLMIGDRFDGVFGTHDLIRIEPQMSRVRAGYLLTFLNDPLVGRSCIIKHACGTSIPHLDPLDISNLRIPRLDPTTEGLIADAAEKSVALSNEADLLEAEATKRALSICEQMIGSISTNQ